MARTRVAAVLACPAVGRVLVVTADPGWPAAARRRRRARCCRTTPDAGLNAALPARRGRAARRRRRGGRAHRRPAGAAPGRAGRRAARGADGRPAVRRFVPDAAGHRHRAARRRRRACCWSRASGRARRPRTRRAARSRSTGDWPSLRRDVDTAADLPPPPRLGLAARARPRWWPPVACARRRRLSRPAATPAHRLTAGVHGASMQGTVATFDAATRSGSLLLDDGTELRFPAAAFDASGLRLLRLGQRVRIEHRPRRRGRPGDIADDV